MSNNTDENPLLSLCICKGTMKYVHIECLNTWIGSRVTSTQSEDGCVISYLIQSTRCEICSTKYTSRVNFNNRIFKIFSYPDPKTGVIVIESLFKDKTGDKRYYYIDASKGKKKFILGRGHESEIKISDISVSRMHSFLNYDSKTNAFNLNDNNSKFGTSVLVQDAIEFDDDKELYIQVGRTIIEAKPPKSQKESKERNTL